MQSSLRRLDNSPLQDSSVQEVGIGISGMMLNRSELAWVSQPK